MKNLLSVEDFGDISKFKDLNGLDMLAMVCEKASEKEEQRKKPSIKMPMLEKKPRPFDLKLSSMATTTHKPRTTHSKRRSYGFSEDKLHTYGDGCSNRKRHSKGVYSTGTENGSPFEVLHSSKVSTSNHKQEEECQLSTKRIKFTTIKKPVIVGVNDQLGSCLNDEETKKSRLNTTSLELSSSRTSGPPRQRPPQPPQLPEKVNEKIQEFGGFHTKFVFKKTIFEGDLNPTQARFTMPMNQCTLSSQYDLKRIANGSNVLVIQPNDGELKACELTFKGWVTNCYILNGGWMNFVRSIETEKPLKVGECLHVWYFKVAPSRPFAPSHGFALVRL